MHANPLAFDGPTLGRALRMLRQKADLTQEEIAEAMNAARPDESTGIHRTSVYRWEKSGRIYFTDLLEFLAALETLVDRDDVGNLDPVDLEPSRRALGPLLYLLAKLRETRAADLDGETTSRLEERFEELERQVAELRLLSGSSSS